LARATRAFCPGGITSFFEICDRTVDGKLLSDKERIGARGGGFVLEKGVLTEVSAAESNVPSIEVSINKRPAPHAETTRTVAAILLEKVENPFRISVHHKVAIPIGAGFGSSGAGALSATLALSRALGVDLTIFQAGRIAHVAEIICHTGLGTVGPIALGGCVITVEPGAPGHAVIDRIPTTSDHRVVTGYYRPIPTKEVLASDDLRIMINKFGKKAVLDILANPSLENFMQASKEFAIKTGFSTPTTEKLIALAEKAGAIGASQNMVGEAVHALATIDKAEKIAEAFKGVLPSKNILVSKIDVKGARLLG
jgi:pantoate kinase